MGCERNPSGKTQVRLSLQDIYQSRNGAQSSGDQITKVAINVHNPAGGPPIVGGWEPMHHDSAVQEMPPPEFILPVQEGPNQLVQVLIVTDKLTGGTIFDYGDQLVNIVPGNNVVEVVTQTLANGEASAEAGIRYIRADGTGPTGVVEMLYQPPGANKPLMLVHELYAAGGWMNAHLFQTTPLQYRLRETGEMLFSNLNYSHPDFAVSTRMMHMKHPVFYADEMHDQAAPYEMIPAGEYFMGFAGPGSTGKTVCYDVSDNSNMSKAWVDSSGSVPFQWSGTSGDTGDFHRTAGGADETSGPCTGGTPFVDTLKLQWEELGEGGGGRGLYGFEGIFAMQKGKYGMTPAQSLYQSRLNTAALSWQALPGVFTGPGAVTGVKVFKRYDPNHNSDYRFNDQIACHELTTKFGFSFAADLPGAAANSVLLQGLSPTNVYDQQVVICPYDAGGKFLNGAATEVRDIGSGVATFGTGADGTRTISTNVSNPAADISILGGKVLMAKRLVEAVSPDGGTLTLQGGTLNSPNTEFEVGDEILWMVLAEDADNCGPELMPGMYGYNYVRSLNTTSRTLTLLAPIVLNGSAVSASALTTADVNQGGSFCRVFVQRVPHFNNLTLDASGGTRLFDASSLQINTSGGGVLAFRVNGVMDYLGNSNFAITASGYGYRGGQWTATSRTGDSYLGYKSNYLSPVGNAGGGFNLYGGGGGGGGASGGNGGSASGTQAGGQGAPTMDLQCGGTCHWEDFFIMGGGGGAGSQSLGDGGNGGGIVAVYARTINRTSGSGMAIFRSDGMNGNNVSGAGEDTGGGGGGGTVQVVAQTLDTNLNLYATGGPGGSASGTGTARAGGGGGGGRLIGRACQGSGNFPAPDANPGSGGTGTESNGAPGSVGWNDVSINTNQSQCWE